MHPYPRQEEDLDLEGKLCCPEESTFSFDDREPRWQNGRGDIRLEGGETKGPERDGAEGDSGKEGREQTS